jgi:ABC-type transport system involved in multi-copper enzyme maturation permease subunit
MISLLLSFVALIFTYDSICGEKKAGTLRLILVASIPRHNLLCGKYLGAMFTIGIPLLVGLLINLLIINSSQTVNLGAINWLKIFIVIVVSLLYLSFFVLLGIFVSTKITHPINCIVSLLLIWTILVILVPSSGRIISSTFHNIPTHADVQRRIRETQEDFAKRILSGKYGPRAANITSSPNNPAADPPARAKYKNEQAETINRIIEDHIRQMTTQAVIGRTFTRFSPAVLYQRASEIIVGAGINRYRSLYQQVKRHQTVFKECVYRKDQEDSGSLHLLFPEEKLVENWRAISQEAVNFATVPKFQEQYPHILGTLRLTIWDIGLLILYNLFLFMASFVSFSKYDAR